MLKDEPDLEVGKVRSGRKVLLEPWPGPRWRAAGD
jgi:hypothetical protein